MTAGRALSEPERYRELIALNLGLAFEDAKLGSLTELLRQRAEAQSLTVDAYLARFETGAWRQETEELAEALTVGETYFFRNRDQFRAFAETVLPDRSQARGPEGRLNFLSAGCSSGEEAYTIAILVRESANLPRTSSIRAVDINPAALARAARGRFTTWALRETPAAEQARWFVQDGRDFVLDPQIRAAVDFGHANLAREAADLWPQNFYDAIFCRNVIMYLTPAVQKAVIARIARSLVPGGYLFLGHAETLRGLSSDFHLVHTHGTFYYQRRGGDRAVASDAYPGLDLVDAPALEPAWFPRPAADRAWVDTIGNAARRIEALASPPVQEPEPAVPWSLGLALDLLRRERFAEALEQVHDLPVEAREDPDVLLLRATLLVHGGQLAAAAEVSRALLALDDMNAGAHYLLGLSFEGAGDRDNAVRHYRLAAHLDPDFAMPLLHLGRLLRRAGDLGPARDQLALALDLLKREDASRLLLFGGGFTRDSLIKLGESELRACGTGS